MNVRQVWSLKTIGRLLTAAFACTVGLLCSASPSVAAQRIFFFDFENEQGIEDVFGTSNSESWNKFLNHVARTTNHPHGGTYCLRSNLGTTSADPITGLPGASSAVTSIGGPFLYGTSHDIRGGHADELYISFWWRWDSGAHNAGVKLIWNQGQNCGAIIEDWNTGTGTSWHLYQEYPTPWDSGYILKTTPFNDGNWHRIEQFFKYSSGLYWARIDGREIYRRNGFANPGARISSFSFAFEHYWRTNENEGFQIDDIEIWDGLPPEHGVDSDNDGVPDETDAFPNNPTVQTTARLLAADNGPADGNLSGEELGVFINRWQAANPADNVQYEEVRLAVEWHMTGVMPRNWGERTYMDEEDIPDNLRKILLNE